MVTKWHGKGEFKEGSMHGYRVHTIKDRYLFIGLKIRDMEKVFILRQMEINMKESSFVICVKMIGELKLIDTNW